MTQLISLAISLLVTYTAALIGSTFTISAQEAWYQGLTKSSLNPSPWVFGPVWAMLYVLMALAAWRVWEHRRHAPRLSKLGLQVYGWQLLPNILWSAAFFGLHKPQLALGIIFALLGAITYNIWLFYRVDKMAAALLAPYVAWVAFAAYLNLSIVLLN